MSVSSTSSSTSSGTINLSGISGYDFSGIISSLVQAYKIPETQMVTQETNLQTKKNAWLDVNTRLSSLDNTLTSLKDLSTWSATSATSSNTDLLGVTTGVNAVQGQYNIKVLSKAQSQTAVSNIQNVSSSTAATSLAAGSFTISVGGKSQTINVSAGDSLQTVADSINNAKAGVSAVVYQVTGGYQLALTDSSTGLANVPSFTDTSGNVLQTLGVIKSTAVSGIQNVSSATAATSLAAGSFTITAGGTSQTINVSAGDSLQTIADAINKNAQPGITAAVNSVAGGYQLAVTNSQAGLTVPSFAVSETSGNVLQTLGGLNNSNVVQSASDASLSVNGVSNITSASNTVTGAILGVTLNINGSDNGASTISVNVTADTSAAQKAVQSFVDQYNSTMSFISTELSYDSTTNTKGDLYGDQELQSIQARLRNITGGTLNNPTGSFNDLSAIGITTSSANYGEDPTLSFDTTKFASAMASDPQSVANLMGASVGTGVELSTGASSPAQGLANIMDSYLQPMIMYGGSIDQNQSSYDSQLTDIKSQIAAFEEKATAYQKTLTARYSTLEATLAGLNSTSSWLTAQINAMTGSSSTTTTTTTK